MLESLDVPVRILVELVMAGHIRWERNGVGVDLFRLTPSEAAHPTTCD
jgi:hypothetical protein